MEKLRLSTRWGSPEGGLGLSSGPRPFHDILWWSRPYLVVALRVSCSSHALKACCVPWVIRCLRCSSECVDTVLGAIGQWWIQTAEQMDCGTSSRVLLSGDSKILLEAWLSGDSNRYHMWPWNHGRPWMQVKELDFILRLEEWFVRR